MHRLPFYILTREICQNMKHEKKTEKISHRNGFKTLKSSCRRMQAKEQRSAPAKYNVNTNEAPSETNRFVCGPHIYFHCTVSNIKIQQRFCLLGFFFFSLHFVHLHQPTRNEDDENDAIVCVCVSLTKRNWRHTSKSKFFHHFGW